MRTIALLSSLALCLPAAVSAQGASSDEFQADVLRPAQPGDEGPLRYGGTPIDRSTATPIQPEDYPQAPLPEGFVNEAVGYDVATGVETYRLLGASTGIEENWVTGRALRDEVPEWQDSFGSPTAIYSSSFPWSTQCRMFFSQSGSNYICSGTLVDARTMITAGHCVHEGGGGAWSSNVSISPAWDGDDGAYGSAFATSLHSYTGWTVSGNFDWDMGFVRVDRPVGFLTGWLGYGYDNNDSFFTGNTFNVGAYPGCNSGCFCNFFGCPDQLYYGFGNFDSVSTYRLTANLTSWCYTGGMSGGAIYWIDGGGSRFVYGDNSTRGTSGCTITSNTWTRMTQPTYDDLNTSVIPGGYSSSLDLVPLDVNTSSTVSAGARLGSLDYLVANASMADPPSATYDADFYLSTNDNISTFDTLLQNRTFTWDFGPKTSVRLTATSTLPQIPEDTVPGSYWVGMILNLADSNPGNNDTDGWDAAPITVTRLFPYLPSSTLFVPSSGVVVDFESTSLSYVASNRLNSDTHTFSSSSWVNYGNLGPVLDPFQGKGCLELGNTPGGGSVTPDNLSALVLRFNGQNGTTFVMDFMLADWGEEFDPTDGVRISQDGDRWYSLTPGGWGPLHPLGVGEWYSVRNVALTGATPVNTDLDFYLAFAAQDNYPFAGLDGIGIDDIRIHRPDQLTLTLSNLKSGATAQLHHSGGTPGSLGCISYSVAGGGPIGTPFGTLYLTPPWIQLPCSVLDPNGNHTLLQAVPPGLAGTAIWFQTLEWPAFTLSNGLALIIK